MLDRTLSQRVSLRWEAANILRGPVDAAHYKTYVFPLPFFKRVSDMHDEECRAALSESDGDGEHARFPQNYRSWVPDDCHWDDVRSVAINIGVALREATRASASSMKSCRPTSSASPGGVAGKVEERAATLKGLLHAHLKAGERRRSRLVFEAKRG